MLPDVDLSHDEGDPRHLAEGETTPLYREGETEPYAYRWNGVGPGHYAEYWRLCVTEAWDTIVNEYETSPDDVHSAWWYVDNHPVFWEFRVTINKDYPVNHVSHLIHQGAWSTGWPEVSPHKVHPVTHRVEKAGNTELEWWYEFGPTNLYGGVKSHDYELDGGAASYEQCVIEVAGKIHKYYGNDRSLVDLGESYWSKRVVTVEPHSVDEVKKEILKRSRGVLCRIRVQIIRVLRNPVAVKDLVIRIRSRMSVVPVRDAAAATTITVNQASLA